MNNFLKKSFLIFVAAVVISSHGTVFADYNTHYTLLEPLPCVQGVGDSEIRCDGAIVKKIKISEYIQYAFNLMVGLSALLAVVMIVYGGFLTMTTDSVSRKSEGKTILKNAIGGLVMVLSTVLILKTINPTLVNIPETLVPSLSKDSSKVNTTGKLYDTLRGISTKYSDQMPGLNSQIAQSKAEIESLSKEINEAKAELAATTGDPEAVPRLETTIKDKTDKLNKAKANLILTEGKLSIVTPAAKLIDNVGGEADFSVEKLRYSDLSNMKAEIDMNYKNNLAILKSVSGTKEQKELSETYYTTATEIAVLKASKTISDSEIKELQTLKDNMILSPIDPNLKRDLKSKIDVAISKINKEGVIITQ